MGTFDADKASASRATTRSPAETASWSILRRYTGTRRRRSGRRRGQPHDVPGPAAVPVPDRQAAVVRGRGHRRRVVQEGAEGVARGAGRAGSRRRRGTGSPGCAAGGSRRAGGSRAPPPRRAVARSRGSSRPPGGARRCRAARPRPGSWPGRAGDGSSGRSGRPRPPAPRHRPRRSRRARGWWPGRRRVAAARAGGADPAADLQHAGAFDALGGEEVEHPGRRAVQAAAAVPPREVAGEPGAEEGAVPTRDRSSRPWRPSMAHLASVCDPWHSVALSVFDTHQCGTQ